MRALLVIWQKVIIYPFYRDNTGFFFFWVMLLVVFQNPATRLLTDPFLSSVIQTPAVLLVILGALLLYFLKCYQYVRAKLTQPEHVFLFTVSLLPTRKIRLSWLLVFVSLYAPALLYIILLAVSALNLKASFIYAGLTFYVMALAGIFINLFTWFHRQLKIEITYRKWLTIRLFPGYDSYLFILGKYIWHEATGLFLLSKGFGLAVTWAFLKFYPPAVFGVRPAAVGFLMGLLGHSLLILRTRYFEEERLLILRQLPFSITRRLLFLLIAYGFALLPEGFFLLSYLSFGFPFWKVLAFYAFGLSFLLLLHVLLYRPVSHKTFYRQIFFLFVSVLFLILFSVPVYILAGLIFAISVSLLHRYYYRFQATWQA